MATHDWELLEDLKDDYACYYFESHIMDEDVVFDYLIHPGSGGGKNVDCITAQLSFSG